MRMDIWPGSVPLEEVVVGVVVASVERMDIWPGSVPLEEVGITNAGTAARRAIWLPTVPIRRPAGGAGRRGTRWRSARSPRNASTVAGKAMVLPTAQIPRFAGGARRRGTR